MSDNVHIAIMSTELAFWQKITEVCQSLSPGGPSSNFNDATSHENGSVSLPLQEQM